MPDICLVFETHQPYRLRRASYVTESWNTVANHFDRELDRKVFKEALRECYLPSARIILDVCKKLRREGLQIKVAFSPSGVFIEQAKRWGREFLKILDKLLSLDALEILSQTYYHSLASLFHDFTEFKEQVKMHRELIIEEFGVKPNVFENTELIYNDVIASIIKDLGFRAIVTEGTERILGWRSPNYLYRARSSGLPVLLRNYRLSDDIAFRFSSRDWDQYPLTADKYVAWLAATPGQYILIFVDYETFGEHHPPETGIHEFLRSLLLKIARHPNLYLATPSDVLRSHAPVGDINVPKEMTVSWADVERDTSAWLGNGLQRHAFYRLECLYELLKFLGDKELLRMWRLLQISDHLYYMSMKGGGAGVVHEYFSPYGSAFEAYNAYLATLMQLEYELKRRIFASKRALDYVLRDVTGREFKFYISLGSFTGIKARNLKEFLEALKTVDIKSLRYHQERGDFFRWIDEVIGDHELARRIRAIDPGNEFLRSLLVDVLKQRLTELEGAV